MFRWIDLYYQLLILHSVHAPRRIPPSRVGPISMRKDVTSRTQVMTAIYEGKQATGWYETAATLGCLKYPLIHKKRQFWSRKSSKITRRRHAEMEGIRQIKAIYPLPCPCKSNHQRLNDLYEMLFRHRGATFGVVHGNLCSSSWRGDAWSCHLESEWISYQRLLPPRGAELEEVKPPTSVLVSSISRWNREIKGANLTYHVRRHGHHGIRLRHICCHHLHHHNEPSQQAEDQFVVSPRSRQIRDHEPALSLCFR